MIKKNKHIKMKRFSLLTLCLMTFYCTTAMPGSDEECVLEARVSAKRSSNSSKVPEATPAAKRSHQQSAAERCKEIITTFLAQQEDFVTSPSLEMHETSRTIPQKVRKETLRVKGILVKGFLFSRRQEEIGAYENGSMSGLFLNFEKCLKPLSKLVAPPLSKLAGKKDPDELSRRIHQLFETFDQGPRQPKFEFLSTLIFQNDHNQIGPRLDRFLTFCGHQHKKHDEIQKSSRKSDF
ncbi:MAG: hypothetical protein C0582_00495 [Alphaproteobacteria bacterium]|nr:MAG: hypothetical protein C0582_00495 [Alphaproteobacteria bacterium]